MDALDSILFYVFALIAVAGALVTAVLPGMVARGYGLLAFAAGVGGLLASLSAGFAGLVGLVCLGACAVLLGSRRPALVSASGAGHQIAGVGAAVLLATLLYVAWRADFATGSYPGGRFGSAAVGRLFFGRDALPLVAVGGLFLAALVGAGAGIGLAAGPGGRWNRK